MSPETNPVPVGMQERLDLLRAPLLTDMEFRPTDPVQEMCVDCLKKVVTDKDGSGDWIVEKE